ncbi:hypothetical protein PFLUV_G00055590 [Perca fluviatilis]|uniref:Uncharacterized protein n=1 Tax=Perca fluviatilis TaxID=8168 RepID=A0A6A5ELL5_PERFL|nr:hypothetical protein PFLUV_G00055590 [Perca fluviatilis]
MKRNYPSGAEKRRKREESKTFLKKLPKLTNFFVMPAADHDNNATTTITSVSTAASEEELPVAADSASPGCSSNIAANVTSKATLQDEEEPSTSAPQFNVGPFSKNTSRILHLKRCLQPEVHKHVAASRSIRDNIKEATKMQLQMSRHHCCVKTAEEKLQVGLS